MTAPLPSILIDANLPRLAASMLRQLGFDAVDVRETEFGAADDSVIAAYAQSERRAIFTSDFDFADIRNYPPELYYGIAVFELRRNETRETIIAKIMHLISRPDIVVQLPGRLAIVDAESIRLRPRIVRD